MNFTRRGFTAAAASVALTGLAACAPAPTGTQTDPTPKPDPKPTPKPEPTPPKRDEFAGLAIDMDNWRYDKEADCFYQLGLTYCLTPASTLEQLAIFVPGAYFTAERHGSVYSCTINGRARVGGLSPTTAPVVMPVNSVRYGAQEPPTSFSADGLGRYLKAGFVYVYAGLRGRSSAFESDAGEVVPGGAPWSLVDLKAAIRYLRYNATSLPCDTRRVVTFGMGGGGGICAAAGASGDSPLFVPYLASIGAAMTNAAGESTSDALFAAAAWCPLMSFDVADAAYEWECGQYATSGERGEGSWGHQLSRGLVAAYATWVNSAGLTDADGTPLMLDAVGDGSYTAGTYYDHVLAATEEAANAFLSTTQFPYTYAPAPTVVPAFPGNPSLTLSSAGDVDAVIADATASQTPGVTNVQATVYDSAEAYVEAMNADTRWLTYNSYWGTVRVSGLWDMARAVREVSLGVAAFDAADRSTFANQLFGVRDQTTLHFSQMVGTVVSDGVETYVGTVGWNAVYPSEWASDLRRRDSLNTVVTRRVDMMNPLAYVCASYRAYGTAQVATHWRINAGLFQTESSLAVVTNLAVALESHTDVETVAFTPVWGRGFELAERTGDAQDNLIAWISDCCTT